MNNNDIFHEIEKELRSLIKDKASLQSTLDKHEEDSYHIQKKMLLGMIELADDFERLFMMIDPKQDDADRIAKKWARNFKTIYKSLLRRLVKFNVTRMNIIIGDDAHPMYHKIVDVEENNSFMDGAIIRVEKTGYFWGKEILREAEIVVSKKASNL